MSIQDRTYRTQTYVAADWTGDADAVDQLKRWNESDYWSLSFKDVHSLTTSRDSSNNCSIKASLVGRMRISKKFVLIVGEHTKLLRSGSCCQCYFANKDNFPYTCRLGHPFDHRSFVDYECDQALSDYNQGLLDLVVLYNSTSVEKDKCPESLRNIGIHVPMRKFNWNTWQSEWDYQTVKNAIMS